MRPIPVFFFLVLFSGTLHSAEVTPTLGWLAGAPSRSAEVMGISMMPEHSV
ncbi:MAG: hypothetical protein ACYC7A_14840 [Thermoanaerobaculia bacterium]